MPRRPAQPARLFVAVHPPPEAACALLAALSGLDLPPRRDVPAAQVHLTLQFIGDTPAARIPEVVESVERSCAGLAPFTLTPTRLIPLPEIGPARLLAAETDVHPTLLELQRRLAHRLARSPRQRAGDRFLPHLTLCRFASPATTPPPARPLHVAPFGIFTVRLLRSVLLPEGAEHRPVASIDLARS